jgi:hypothetical protein
LTAEHSQSQQQNHELIDDAFYLHETQYKIWHSFDKDGKPLITSLTKENCISATRFYLKGCQEGWPEQESVVTYDGVVGGKL